MNGFFFVKKELEAMDNLNVYVIKREPDGDGEDKAVENGSGQPLDVKYEPGAPDEFLNDPGCFTDIDLSQWLTEDLHLQKNGRQQRHMLGRVGEANQEDALSRDHIARQRGLKISWKAENDKNTDGSPSNSQIPRENILKENVIGKDRQIDFSEVQNNKVPEIVENCSKSRLNSSKILAKKTSTKNKTKNYYQKHQRNHKNPTETKPRQKKLKCKYCDKIFSHGNKWKMQRHLDTHEIVKKSIECSKCPKSFSSYRNLNIHMRLHTNRRLNVCKFCGRKFPRRENFRNHLKTHSSEKFSCDICGKHFFWKNSLRSHVLKHFLGEKLTNRNFSCALCDKTYTRERDLLLHGVVHFDIKPYECDKCMKTFFRKSSLVRHERSHRNKKDFECLECGYACTRPYFLKNHLLICRKSRFSCEFCKKQFEGKLSLNSHILRTHLNKKKSLKKIMKRNKTEHESVSKSALTRKLNLNPKVVLHRL